MEQDVFFTKSCRMCVPTCSRQKGMVNEDDSFQDFSEFNFLSASDGGRRKICVQFQVEKLVRIDTSHCQKSFI